MSKRVFVITGGSKGLGLAAARCLAAEGKLLLCARGKGSLEAAVTDLREYGADAEGYSLDVSDEKAVQACAAYAASLGEVCGVIHTAGVSSANAPLEDVLHINAMGPIFMVQAFLPVLAEGGVMLCFSSMAGYNFDVSPGPLYDKCKAIYKGWDQPDFLDRIRSLLSDDMKLPAERQAGAAYAITKNFVKHFVFANIARFARKGCRILSVSPGCYLTPMHQALIDNAPESAERVRATIPCQRWGHPYEMGELVKFLCSPGAAYISGVDILADAGATYMGAVEQIP